MDETGASLGVLDREGTGSPGCATLSCGLELLFPLTRKGKLRQNLFPSIHPARSPINQRH